MPTSARRPFAVLAVSVLCAAGCAHTSHGTAAAPRVSSHRPAPPASAGQLSAVQVPWQLPTPVSRPAAVVHGAGVLLLGGLHTGDVSTAAVVAVDPAAGTAAQIGHLAEAVHDAAASVASGGVYVFGGGAASTVGTVQEWTGTTAAPVAQLPQPRSDLAAAAIGPTSYILGGFDGRSALVADVLATTDGRSFRLAGKLAQPVRYPAVAVLGGDIWVIGGLLGTTESNAGAQTSDIQRFDPRTGRTTVVGQLPVALAHASAVALDGALYVAGGKLDGQPQSTIYRVDTATGSVRDVGNLPGPRADAGAVTVDGDGWLFGGELTSPAAPLATVVRIHLSR